MTAPSPADRLAAALVAGHSGAAIVGRCPGAIVVALPSVRPRTVMILDVEHDGLQADDARRDLSQRIAMAVEKAPPGAAYHFVAVNLRGLEITDVLRAHFWPLAFQSWQQMFAGKPFTVTSQRFFSAWNWRPGESLRRVRGERLPVLVQAVAALQEGVGRGDDQAATAPTRTRRRPLLWWFAAVVLALAPIWLGPVLERLHHNAQAAGRAAAHARLPWQLVRVAIAGTPVSLEVPFGMPMLHDPGESLRHWRWGHIATDEAEIHVFVPPSEPGDFPPGPAALDALVEQFARLSEPGLVRIVPPQRARLPSGREGVCTVLRPAAEVDARRLWSWWLVEGDQAVWIQGNVRAEAADRRQAEFLRIVDSVRVDAPVRGR